MCNSVGNVTENIKTKLYKVPVMDLEENWWQTEACGISEISSPVTKVNVPLLAKVLGVKELDLARPSGKLEFLVGADYACLIPVLVKTAGNLQFMKNQFGYCIRGSCGFDRENKLKGITVVVNHVSFYPSKENREITPLCKLEKYFNYFFTINGLGIQCYPTCGGCACGKCSVSID